MKNRSLKTTLSVVLGPLLVLLCQVAFSDNIRIVFPQIAVGGPYVTVIDLTNKGVQTFTGFMGVYGDDGYAIGVVFNNSTSVNPLSVSIPPGGVLRVRVTKVGAVSAGYAVAWDTRPSGNLNYNEQLSGVVTFQWWDGTTLVDAVGVSPPSSSEHFFFIAETSETVNTGLALTFSGSGQAPVTIKALSQTNQFLDGRTIVLNQWEHRSFFIPERLSLPLNFRGTIEVESNKLVDALVLRLERNQLSAVDVAPFRSIYDFTITLTDGRTFSGELSLSTQGGTVRGLARYTTGNPDQGWSQTPISGPAAEGVMVATMYASFGGTFAVVLLGSASARTTADTFNASVSWLTDKGDSNGTLIATRRR